MIRFLLRFIYKEIMAKKAYSLRVIFSISIGVGAVVGINSYKQNLKNTIQKEAKKIMGADLTISSSRKLSAVDKAFIKKNIPPDTQTTTLTYFASMLLNPKNGETTLSTVKVLGKQYPFYGKITTKPKLSYQSLKSGEVLLEPALQKQLQVRVGESVTLGFKTFVVRGIIENQPAITGGFMAMAPTVIMPAEDLAQTGLEARGSRIRYNILLRLPQSIDARKWKKEKFSLFINRNLTLYHSTEIGSGSQRFINATFDFMSLLGLSAFFLGAIAILLSSKTRIEERLNEIAVMKCLGAKTNLTIYIFIGELVSLSLVGIIAGAITAYFFQFWIPDITGSPFLAEIKPALSIPSLFWGFGLGLVIPIVVGLESIMQIVGLTPLHALRKNLHSELQIRMFPSGKRILQVIIAYVLFFGIAFLETGDIAKGIYLSLSLAILPVLLLVLYNFLRILSGFIFRLQFFRGAFALVLKKISQTGHGLALPIIGIGSALTVLLLSIYLRTSLLELGGNHQVEKRPNLFILDVKKEQLGDLQQILKKYKAEDVYLAPVVGARLFKINGKRVEKENTERDARKRDWKSTARTREYFLSYRQKLYKSERVIEGEFWQPETQEQISIEVDFAKSLAVEIGDILTFNVLGREISGKITNTRKVSWTDMKPNFVVLFSPGVLDKAPGYFLGSFRIIGQELRYQFQKDLIADFPNITIIDIKQSIRRFLNIVNKITDIIELMTYFILFSSLLLLLSALDANRSRRLQETALYRVIGARSGFIRKMYVWEAMWLAVFAYVSALVLSTISGFIISERVINIRFHLPLVPLLLVFFATLMILTLVYLLNIRSLLKRRPGSYIGDVL